MVIIFLYIIILFIIIFLINSSDEKTVTQERQYDLNNLVIINRNDEQQKLVENLLNSKKMLYSENEYNSLQNTTQFYNVENNVIENITSRVNNNNNNNNINNSDNMNLFVNPIINNNNNNGNNNNTTDEINITDSYLNSPIDYNKSSSINDCNDIVLNDNSCSNKLDNYYRDIFGNKIQSSMNDYITTYNTTIDETNATKCRYVKTLKGNNDFIIPNQYEFEKYWTNAYNVDYSRVINPMTIY